MFKNVGHGEELQVGIQKKRLEKMRILNWIQEPINKHRAQFHEIFALVSILDEGFRPLPSTNYIPHRFPGRTVVTIHDMSYRCFRNVIPDAE